MHPTTGDPTPPRIATYARVGSGRTEDQDSAARLQAARIKDFAKRHNVQTVAQYTDLGVARSTPWRARPAARTKMSCRLTGVRLATIVTRESVGSMPSSDRTHDARRRSA
ncbi:MAG: hypothetical protein ACJ786_34825 [Catenulispora sp.]